MIYMHIKVYSCIQLIFKINFILKYKISDCVITLVNQKVKYELQKKVWF